MGKSIMGIILKDIKKTLDNKEKQLQKEAAIALRATHVFNTNCLNHRFGETVSSKSCKYFNRETKKCKGICFRNKNINANTYHFSCGVSDDLFESRCPLINIFDFLGEGTNLTEEQMYYLLINGLLAKDILGTGELRLFMPKLDTYDTSRRNYCRSIMKEEKGEHLKCKDCSFYKAYEEREYESKDLFYNADSYSLVTRYKCTALKNERPINCSLLNIERYEVKIKKLLYDLERNWYNEVIEGIKNQNLEPLANSIGYCFNWNSWIEEKFHDNILDVISKILSNNHSVVRNESRLLRVGEIEIDTVQIRKLSILCGDIVQYKSIKDKKA